MSSASSCSLPSSEGGNNKLPQKHVLFLSPRWSSDQHGIATLTHHLVKDIRSVDPTGSHVKIYCLVALLDQYISREEKLEARDNNVVLIGARPPRGDESTPSIKWLDLYPSTYYAKTLEHLPQMTHIIGHLPYIPNGPTNIRDYLYRGDPSVKAILVNHEAPYNENRNRDVDQLEAWCKSSDVVVSVGRSLFDFTETVLTNKNSDTKHDLYTPACPVDFLKYDWLDYHELGSYGHVTGTQNILVCCPERHITEALRFEMAVESIASAADFLLHSTEPNDKVRVALNLTICDKDRDHWKSEFHKIMEKQEFRQIGLSLHSNENMDKMMGVMNKASLLVHPQNHESSYLGLDVLCAASMGIPVLVQEHSSIACLLESIQPGTTSAVKKLDNNETEEEAWSRMIVDKLTDPELAAEQAADIRTGLLRDTSIQRSHVTFIKNIFDAFQLKIDFNGDCAMTSTGKKLGMLFGIAHKTKTDEVFFIASVLSHLLHQREKTSVQAIHKLIVPSAGAKLDDVMHRLLTSLEDESRCVLDIKASKSDQILQNELLFDIHCTTINEVLGLYEQLSKSDNELPQLLLNILDTLADFNNITLKVEKHEDSEPIPDINDFKIYIRRKSSGSKEQSITNDRKSKVPVAKPSLRSKPTYTAMNVASTSGYDKQRKSEGPRARKPMRRQETYDVDDDSWGVRLSDSPGDDYY